MGKFMFTNWPFQNYSQIESAMLFGLEKNYKSDDMNNTDEMSDRWNTFFIQVKTHNNKTIIAYFFHFNV